MHWLNYHHLYYFYRVAQEGNLSETARKLRVSQSAVTIQLKALSQSLKADLFVRSGRRLVLTETGHRVLEYADTIFRTGKEMVESLKSGEMPRTKKLQIGATGGLSKNFQVQLVEPMIRESDLELHIVIGDLESLLARLRDFRLDLVISHTAPPIDSHRYFRVSEMGRSPYILARPKSFKIGKQMKRLPTFVSVSGSGAHIQVIRHLEKSYQIRGMIEDVALLRSMILDHHVFVVTPKIALKKEIESGAVVIEKEFRNLDELFYAVSRTGNQLPSIAEKALNEVQDAEFIKSL